MKIIIKIVAIIGMALFFTGCAQPSFNPNIKHIVYVDGKPFRVPTYDTFYRKHTYNKNLEVDKKILNFYRQNGFICKEGDLLWAKNSVIEKVMKNFKSTGNRKKGYVIISSASKVGKAGCASPLSNQEYQFYRGKEMEASANARAKAASDAAAYTSYMNYMAATAPKTVNVQHSGYINQNVQYSGYVNVYGQ